MHAVAKADCIALRYPVTNVLVPSKQMLFPELSGFFDVLM